MASKQAYSSKLYNNRQALKDYRAELYRVKEYWIHGIWCVMELIANVWRATCFMPDGEAKLIGCECPKRTIQAVRNWILETKWTIAS